MTYDIVTTAISQGWKRPICFANTLPSFSYLGLSDYLYQRGNVYELLPLKPRQSTKGSIYKAAIQDSLTHHLLTEVFRYRNLNNPRVFYDQNTLRMINTYRSVFYRLAEHYVQKALEKDSASTAEAAQLRQKVRELLTLLNDRLAEHYVQKAREKNTASSPEAAQLRQKGRELLTFLNEKISPEACPLEAYQVAQEASLWLDLGDTAKATALTSENLTRLESEVAYLSATRDTWTDMELLYAGVDGTLRIAMALRQEDLTRRALLLGDKLRALDPSPRRRR